MFLSTVYSNTFNCRGEVAGQGISPGLPPSSQQGLSPLGYVDIRSPSRRICAPPVSPGSPAGHSLLLCNTSPARRNCVNVAARSSFSITRTHWPRWRPSHGPLYGRPPPASRRRAPTAALAPGPWLLAHTRLSRTPTTLTSSVALVLCLCLGCIFSVCIS